MRLAFVVVGDLSEMRLRGTRTLRRTGDLQLPGMSVWSESVSEISVSMSDATYRLSLCACEPSAVVEPQDVEEPVNEAAKPRRLTLLAVREGRGTTLDRHEIMRIFGESSLSAFVIIGFGRLADLST